MIIVRATWNVPGDSSAAAVDGPYFGDHVPRMRALPGLTGQVLLKFLSTAGGGLPWWWRGEELTFATMADFEAAAGDWKETWASALRPLVSGPRIDVFELEDEFLREDPPVAAGAGPAACLSGIWQVPAKLTPAEVDDVYLDVHVPNVRALPGLRRHRALRAVEWPAGNFPRAWRAAEIRYDTLPEFEAVYDTPEYDAIRQDGFNASIAGPEVDIYLIEEEWRR